MSEIAIRVENLSKRYRIARIGLVLLEG